MKKNQNKIQNGLHISFLLLCSVVWTVPLSSFAQEQSPLPGNGSQTAGDSIQSPAIDSTAASAPVPGASSMPSDLNPQVVLTLSKDSSIPFSLPALQSLVQELKKGQAGNTEESLNKHLLWLDILIKAHNKLAVAFAKQENTQAACNNERNLSKQLYQVKDQILYLKAQLLIKENRWPEAINILVDIIAVEPQSPLGEQAYKRLIEAGFSPETARQLSSRLYKSNPYRGIGHRPM